MADEPTDAPEEAVIEPERAYGALVTDSRGQRVLHPTRETLVATVTQLHSDGYNQLIDVTAVDYLPAGHGRFFRRDLDIELQFSTETPARRVTLNQEGDSFTATRVPSGAEP